MKYLFIALLLLGFNAQAEVFNTEPCQKLDWSYRVFDIGELRDGSAWDNAHLDDIDMISLRGVRQGGHKGRPIFYTSTVGKVYLEFEFSSKHENISSITCGGRKKLNYKSPILQKEQEIRTSHRNMIATLTSQNWEEYAPIAHSVAVIHNATNGQEVGLLMTIKDNGCELRAYSADQSEIEKLRTSYEYTSKAARKYETKKPLQNCIVYSEDVQEILQNLKYLVYKGPQDKEKDMPLVPKGPPPLKDHL